MQAVDRSLDARIHREPDVFLSHSARDKEFVWKLAEDLAFCEVDVWLDQWELQPGESLHDAVGQALERSKYIGIVMGPNFADSRWASDEMNQGLARERRENRTIVIPILAAESRLPAFLDDKLYIDLRTNYFAGVARLAAMVNDVPRQHIEEGIRTYNPQSISECIQSLRYAGFEPYVVLSSEDAQAVLRSGGQTHMGDKIRFSPEQVAANPAVSPRLRRLMQRLGKEVWQ